MNPPARPTLSALLAEIQALEVELHHPGVACERQRLEHLLHPDFSEIGRSGREYDRATVLHYLAERTEIQATQSDAFTLSGIAPGVVLLSYRSALVQPDGRLDGHTFRSSVWVRENGHWQLRYHQGTPAAQGW